MRYFIVLFLILSLAVIACGKSDEEKAAELMVEATEELAEQIAEMQDEGQVIRKELEATLNFSSVQMNLAKYRTDYGPFFPSDISEILGKSKLIEFPTNSYTGKPMKNIEFGSEPFEGEFTYVRYTQDGNVTGYFLICYGPASNEGEDVNGDGERDHVLDVYSSVSIALGITPIKLEDLLNQLS